MQKLSEELEIFGVDRLVQAAEKRNTKGTHGELRLAAQEALKTNPAAQVFTPQIKSGGAVQASFLNEVWQVDIVDFSQFQ